MVDKSSAMVSGGNILSMLTAMGAFRRTGEQILGRHGIADVTPEAWYTLQSYVDALNEIEEKIGPSTLFRVGKEIPNHINLPPGLEGFDAVIGSFGPAFSMNHRGAGAGNITFEMTGASEGEITSGTPYPCEFDRGVIQGFFQKLVKGTCNYQHHPSICKKTGSGKCVHKVKMMYAAK